MSSIRRIVTGAGAAASLVLALAHPAFRSPAGALSGAIAVPLAVAAALALAAVWRRDGLPSLALAALFLLGQAMSLQLVRAGSEVGYQHWLSPVALWSGEARLAVVFLVLQALIVAAVALRIRAWRAVSVPSVAGLVLVVLFFVATAAAPSRQVVAYAAELALAAAIQSVQLVNLWLAVALLPRESLRRTPLCLSRESGGARAEQGHPEWDRFVAGAVVWVIAVTALLAVFVYERHPHIPDEIGYLVQGHYFSRGLLSLASPPVPEAFHLYMFALDSERWFSALPPGWPIVLGLGGLAGAAWLVNPLLSGLNVVLTYRLLMPVYGLRTTRLAVLLLCLSPWFLFMGMSFMNHQWALTCALVAALGMYRLAVSERISWPWVLAAGLGLGGLGAIRPLEALATALLLGIAMILGRQNRWRRVLRVSAVAAVALLASLPQLAYNRHYTGQATRFPVMEFLERQYGAGTNALGFGADRGFGWTGLDPFPGHGARDVVVNALLNSSQVNLELLGWSIGSVLVLAVFVVFGRKRRVDWLMIAAAATIIGAHSLYWFSGGPDFGARYWYLILVPCIALTARGLPFLGRVAGVGRVGGIAAALLLSLAATLTFVPWRAADKYHAYRGMTPDILRLAEEEDFGADLILVRGLLWPDYASTSVYNPLDLDAPAPVYARDIGPEVTEALLRHYADRRVWVVEGPSLTGDWYRVVEGPTPAERMLEDLARAGAPGQQTSR